MTDSSNENDQGKTALRELLEESDAKYPAGWFVAVGDGRPIAASGDFDELLEELRAQGSNPRETLVVEAGAKRPEYVTIFI